MAVALVGPRQSGKTTLARPFRGLYFDLEQDPERLRLDLASPTPADMAPLDKTAEMIGASRGYLISKTKRTMGDETRASCNLGWLLERLQNAQGV